MEEQNLESLRLLVNNSPLDDFCGLSRNEMHHLVYDVYAENSPIRVRSDISGLTLDGIPFFRLTEELLKVIHREGTIKLTATGALPRRILHELYGHRLMPDDVIEAGYSNLIREANSMAITSMRLNTEMTGLTRKANGKISLTKKGGQLLHAEKRHELFRVILETFTEKFNWAYNDIYTEFPVGQLGWGFTIYLLLQAGDEQRSSQFYADKYLNAFPTLLQYFTAFAGDSPKKWFGSCYFTRTFRRFLEWFGFVDIKPYALWGTNANITRTQVFTDVFCRG